jgi:hypothetical protein
MRTIHAHDHDGTVYTEDGNTYVEERIMLVPNQYGYGHHNEHGHTTRSRALTRARAALGQSAVLVANLGPVHTNRHTRVRYSVVTPGK